MSEIFSIGSIFEKLSMLKVLFSKIVEHYEPFLTFEL